MLKIILLSSNTSYDTTGYVWQMFNVVIVLFITVVLIYLFAYIAKKLKLDNKSSYAKNISILEYKNIGNNSNLIISKVGEKYILLGSTKEKIDLLCELNESELNIKVEDTSNNTINFSEILNDKLKKKNKNETEKQKDEDRGI